MAILRNEANKCCVLKANTFVKRSRRGWSMSFSNPSIWISAYSNVCLEDIQVKAAE